MKIRQVFVSNSSSASFVIRWKPTEGGTSQNVQKLVTKIMYPDIEDKKTFKYRGATFNKTDNIQEILAKTTTIADEYFITSAWTVMDNGDPEDFGIAMRDFVSGLERAEKDEIPPIKILEKEVSED